MGNHNKGKAVQRVIDLFGKQFSHLATIGVGNDCNDKEMLEAVDYPFFIETPEALAGTGKKVLKTTLKLGRDTSG
jgi:predicted mannosyl-3-phosphoglycerate phosphatase (HAD superfamily)